MTARFLKASVCVIRLSRRLRQIIQTSALIILAVMPNLIQQLLIASFYYTSVKLNCLLANKIMMGMMRDGRLQEMVAYET